MPSEALEKEEEEFAEGSKDPTGAVTGSSSVPKGNMNVVASAFVVVVVVVCAGFAKLDNDEVLFLEQPWLFSTFVYSLFAF